MSGIDRWLDALEKKFTRLVEPPPEPDPWMASRDLAHIEVVSSGEVSAAEWEAEAVELELRNAGLLRSRYARDAFAGVEGTLGAAAKSQPRGLIITMSYDLWEPPAPSQWEAVAPPPAPRPPVPHRPEPAPAAPLPGTGPEHIWPRWF